MENADQFANRIRFYHYISGVLSNQQADPLCSICKAFTNTTTAVRGSLEEFEKKHAGEILDIDDELMRILTDSKKSLAELNPPEDAQGQKKAGKCKMPEGVCFIKSSKAILEKI